MDRVNQILKNKIYIENLEKLNSYERDREFCRHDLEHFMTMARIAYILVLEKGLSYSKEVIYAIGLLHDIGRVLQYEKDIPHHEGSLILSKEILKNIPFSKEEKEEIYSAIESHRTIKEDGLANIIYKSDKLSRDCYRCKAEKECYWSNEKKNLEIKY